jgi:hypothetical protein
MAKAPDGWDHVETATDCDVASGRGPNMPPPAEPKRGS